MFGLKHEHILLIQEAIAKYPDVEEAVVFGSRAIGNYKRGSDIDIALKGSLLPKTCSALFVELNEYLPVLYKFDVVEYAAIEDPCLKEHIDHWGKVLYQRQRNL